MTESLHPCMVCGTPGETFLVNWSPMALCPAHEQWTDTQIFQFLGTKKQAVNAG